jgi:hypothetical protein
MPKAKPRVGLSRSVRVHIGSGVDSSSSAKNLSITQMTAARQDDREFVRDTIRGKDIIFYAYSRKT